MKGTKHIILLTLAALVAATGSYWVGRTGFTPGPLLSTADSAITNSRCEAGAFIPHVAKPTFITASAQGQTSSLRANTPDTSLSSMQVSGLNLIAGGVTGAYRNPTAGWRGATTGLTSATYSTVASSNAPYALRVQVNGHVSGSAAWTEQPVSVSGGSYYLFTDTYRSNVTTRGVLTITAENGTTQVVDLPTAGPAATWTNYNASFFVPVGTKSLTIVQSINRRGWLETNNYSLSPASYTGFSQGLVSLTFDNGWATTYTNALPLLKKYDITSTQYVVAGYLGTPAYMSMPELYAFKNQGSEIASQGTNYQDLTRVSPAALSRDIAGSAKGLNTCSLPQTDFAAPAGATNAKVTAQITDTYQTNRSMNVGFNAATNFNPSALQVETLTTYTTTAQLASWLATAKADHLWLILVYHQVDNTHSLYSRTPSQLNSDLEQVKASGLATKTINNAYSEVKSQVSTASIDK